MMILKFDLFSLADAEILGIAVEAGSVVVAIKDWQEVEFSIKFEEALAVQAINPFCEDLDGGVVEEHDPFMLEAFQVSNETEVAKYRTYSFISASTGLAILKIVAETAHVRTQALKGR